MWYCSFLTYIPHDNICVSVRKPSKFYVPLWQNQARELHEGYDETVCHQYCKVSVAEMFILLPVEWPIGNTVEAHSIHTDLWRQSLKEYYPVKIVRSNPQIY